MVEFPSQNYSGHIGVDISCISDSRDSVEIFFFSKRSTGKHQLLG